MQNRNRLDCCPGGYRCQFICIDEKCRAPAVICNQKPSCSFCEKSHVGCTPIKWTQCRSIIVEKISQRTLTYHFISFVGYLLHLLLGLAKFAYQKWQEWRDSQCYVPLIQEEILKKVCRTKAKLTGQQLHKFVYSEQQRYYQWLSLLILIAVVLAVGAYFCMGSVPSLMPNQIQENMGNFTDEKPVSELIGVELDKKPEYSFNSTITNDKQFISSLFDNKIEEIKLLYRASDYGFSTEIFHKLCDNKPNMMVLILNNYEKKRAFGAYSPVPFESSLGYEHTPDPSGKTCLFSINNREKYPMLPHQRQNALYNSEDWGPGYGYGCDLRICNRADRQKKSYINFPSSFHNPSEKDDKKARYRFTGIPFNGEFLVSQWEVHQVVFEGGS